MFEHNPSWAETDEESGLNMDKFEIKYLDSNGNVINTDMNILGIEDIIVEGISTMLAQYRNRFVFRADNKNGTARITRNFTDMKQYVNMGDSCYYDADYNWNSIHFDNAGQSGLLINPTYYVNNGIYIKGTEDNDHYYSYTFDLGQFTINDAGSPTGDTDGDEFNLNMDRDDYRFFVDFDKDGHIANSDLIIYQYSDTLADNGLYQYLHGGDVSNYVVIKNAFDLNSGHDYYDGTGAIEWLTDNENDSYDIESLIGTIQNNIANWVTGYNNSYGTVDNPITTVSQAIADGQASNAYINQLYGYYNTNTHEGW